MFKHEKQLLHPVRVDGPNPNYAAIKDLLLDIAAEELSHMEMVATFREAFNKIQDSGSNRD